MSYHRHVHVCGFYYIEPPNKFIHSAVKKYLPQLSLKAHASIVASTSRTTLTQTFVNPQADKAIPELRYTFPLYDGVSVVAFTCTINRERVIKGIVKERAQARKTYDAAVARGETAGLLEQLPEASDVFTTTVGNIPAGAELQVDITYLGELKHDAEVDGIRLTIPTSIAPRYGTYPGELLKGGGASTSGGIEIVVDAEMPAGSQIQSVQSPSHPIAVTIGNTSTAAAAGAPMSLQKASATLSLGTTELDKDFVLHVVATNTSEPLAVLETHPAIPNHRALMATLVPKFSLPPARPEIVFVCDRSGSMAGGSKISNLQAALNIFLKSMPLGTKFNICSFGSRHEFLFDRSQPYDQSSLAKATKYIAGFSANFGGTEMYRPVEDAFKRRYKDMELAMFMLTDGEIWDQETLFSLVNKNVEESAGAVRVFTLGIGHGASSALVEGLARAGNGFAQFVSDNEKMSAKMVRMLKACLMPHVKDYTLEVKYGGADVDEKTADDGARDDEDSEDDFEIIEKVMDALAIHVEEKAKPASPAAAEEVQAAKPISLFDPSHKPDDTIKPASDVEENKYAGVPAVPPPKILQAPFSIPPLYPFNRTSVFLLLSPETTRRTPKSVVLRGTSIHGPLELEIPVTVLTEKGETVHQLAARKAVRELEDGRGWIAAAKDSADGKLLKEKYDGHYQDMVEREAVRLGVEFQVGGKWTSFVAVDQNSKDEEKDGEAEAEKRSEMYDLGKNLFSMASPAAGSGSEQYKAKYQYHRLASAGLQADRRFLGPVAVQSAEADEAVSPAGNVEISAGVVHARMARRSLGGAVINRLMSTSSKKEKNAGPSGGHPSPSPTSISYEEESNANMFRTSAKSMQITPTMAAGRPMPGNAISLSQPQDSFFGRGAAPPPTFGMSSQAPSRMDVGEVLDSTSDSAPRMRYRKKAKASPFGSFNFFSRSSSAASAAVPPPPPAPASQAQQAQHAPGLMSVGPAAQPSGVPAAAPVPTDTLEALVQLQTFEGYWAWSDELLAILKVDKAAVLATGKDASNITTSALVVAFLQKKMADRKDEWEMLVEKAVEWIEAQGSGVTAQALVNELASFF